MRKSISTINRYLISFFLLVDIALVVATGQYVPESQILMTLACVMLVNLAMFWIYTLINTRYWTEHDRLFEYFSEFIRDKKDPSTFPPEEEFMENARFLSLFKRTYVEQKILKKDYAEFKTLFETFIPKEIYEKLGFKWYERVVLGAAERKYVTVMFLDIMKFTTVSESMADPYRALLLLNIYFDGIGEIIYKYHGYIDKFLGDGILAVFDNSNSDDALHAAIEIQEFMKKFQISTIGKCIEIGIGISTGTVIMGTVGTKRRMDATVIGDTVNIAARLQDLTHVQPDYKILITAETFQSLAFPELFSTHDLGINTLTGKEEKVQIYGIDIFERIELPKVTI